MWALVKWVGGTDDKKMTPGINILHIKDFDMEEFLSDDHDPGKMYVVEWRDTKKMPLGGWKCYNGLVIEVSASIKLLEKKIKALDGIMSPGPSLINNNTDDEEVNTNDDDITNTNARKRLRFSDPPDSLNVTEDNHPSPNKSSNSNIVTKQLSTKEIPEASRPTEHLPSTSKSSDSNIVTNKPTPTPNPIPDPSRPTDNQFVYKEDFEKAMLDIKNLIKSAIQPAGSSEEGKNCTEKSNASKSSKKNKYNRMKELGHEGTGVFITQEQWDAAKSKASFTAMTTALLISTFSVDTLRKSNYKGGKSKNTGDKVKKYEALDTHIINAIKESVKDHHENFKDGAFGTAINNKCGRFRSEQKCGGKQNDAGVPKEGED